jgi:Maltokinase N-terminal cap domain
VALLYAAQIVPSKLEVIAGWLPGQDWWSGDPSAIETVGAYRFDDPAGAVGIETHLVRAGSGPIVQVPLTYRDAPIGLPSGAFICTMKHTVLGTRWIYDGCFDPVFAAALATAILTGGTQASQQIEIDGELVEREPSVRVVGSGTPGSAVPQLAPFDTRTVDGLTTLSSAALELLLRRVLGPLPTSAQGRQFSLTGTWTGAREPELLARAQRR